MFSFIHSFWNLPSIDKIHIEMNDNNILHKHTFHKDKTITYCMLCYNIWVSMDSLSSASNYQLCSRCSIHVHTSCKSFAETCLPCNYSSSSKYNIDYNKNNSIIHPKSGTFIVKLLQVYDINTPSGTSLYGLLKLSHKSQICRSPTTNSESNECIWDNQNNDFINKDIKDPGIMKFSIHINNISIDITNELDMDIELWSSYLSIFDNLVCKGKFSILPVMNYPNTYIERWFPIENMIIEQQQLTTGKMFLKMIFIPLEDIVTTTDNDIDNTLQLTSQSTFSITNKAANNVIGNDNTTTETTSIPLNTSHVISSNSLTHININNNNSSNNHTAVVEDSCTTTTTITTTTTTIIPSASTDDDNDDSILLSILSLPKDCSSHPSTLITNKVMIPITSVSSGCGDDSIHDTSLPHIDFQYNNNENNTSTNNNNNSSNSNNDNNNSYDHEDKFITTMYQSVVDFTDITTTAVGNFFYNIDTSLDTAITNTIINTAISSCSNKTITKDGDWNEQNEEEIALLKDSTITTANTDENNITAQNNMTKNQNKIISSNKNKKILQYKGVGYIHIHLVSVFKTIVEDAAEGNHYVLAILEGSNKEFKSKTIYGSASPIFNVKWTIRMEHYRAAINIYLMDAHTHRKIAFVHVTCYSLIQRDIDRKYKSWKDAMIEKIPMRNVSDTEDLGYVTARIAFEENLVGLFTGDVLQEAANGPKEQLSVQRLSTHIARFTAILTLIKLWYQEYKYVMEWKDPLFTLIILLIFLYCTIQINAEYAMSGILFLIVVLLTRSLFRRNSGKYARYYIEKGIESQPKVDYRPIGKLRIAVIGFRSTNKSLDLRSLSHRLTVKVTYLPMFESDISGGGVGLEDGIVNEQIIGYFGPSHQALKFNVPTTHQGFQSGVSQLVSTIVSGAGGAGGSGGTGGSMEPVHKDNTTWFQHMYDPWPISNTNNSSMNNDNSSNNNSSSSNIDYKRADKFSSCYYSIQSESAEISLIYPILQPIRAKLKDYNAVELVEIDHNIHSNYDHIKLDRDSSSTTSTTTPTKPSCNPNKISNSSIANQSSPLSNNSRIYTKVNNKIPYLPWAYHEGNIKISLIDEQSTSFVSTSDTDPYVTISLTSLLTNNETIKIDDNTYELLMWYKTNENNIDMLQRSGMNEVDLFAYDSSSAILMSKSSNSKLNNNNSNDSSNLNSNQSYNKSSEIEIQVRIRITLPTKKVMLFPNKEELNNSIVLQSLLKTKEKETSTISVLWSMPDNITYVQNLMNWLLDLIESTKNIFNWTNPSKTFPFYLCIIAIWLLTIIIPGRYLVLGLGLYQFFIVFIPIPEGRNMAIRFGNLLQSIPNDDDLANIYDRESKLFTTKTQKNWKEIEKDVKLTLTLPLFWKGVVFIKDSSNNTMNNNNINTSIILLSNNNNNDSCWYEVYLLLQGNRLIWWRSEEDIDCSKKAMGQLLLCGHCGITQASPVDIRQFGGDKLLLAVFGSDHQGRPQKLSLKTKDEVSKKILYSKIEKQINNLELNTS